VNGWKLCSQWVRKEGLEMEICLSGGETKRVDASTLGLLHSRL
jgi:hypothetical protein